MLHIQGNILTTKGQLAPRARDLISKRLLNDLEPSFTNQGWTSEGKGWYIPIQDSEGHIVYAVVELKVSTNDPTKPKPTKSAKASEAISWE